MQQSQKFRHDTLYRICNKDLVAVQLDFVSVQIDVALDAGEIKDTGQVERIIHIQVNPEQRLFRHRVEVLVELLIVLVLQFRRFAHPGRRCLVDDVVFLGIDILPVLPFLLFAEGDRNWEEAAILSQKAGELLLVQEVLVLVVDVEDDVRTTVFLGCLLHCIFRRTVATPFHRNRTFLARLRNDFYLLGNHERRVEAQTEVADDGSRVVLILLNELLGAGESDLVDILVDFFGCHTDTTVGNGDCLVVELNPDGQVAHLTFELADGSQCLQLLRRIDGIGNQLTKENLVVAVQKLLDNRENVFTCNSNIT